MQWIPQLLKHIDVDIMHNPYGVREAAVLLNAHVASYTATWP